MTDTDTTEKGRAHDIDPTAVVGFYSEVRRLEYDDKAKDHLPPGNFVASGNTDLFIGVYADEVTIETHTKGHGYADSKAVNSGGRMNIEATENLIRGLIKCVKEAKKNRIDKPSLFGGGYDS